MLQTILYCGAIFARDTIRIIIKEGVNRQHNIAELNSVVAAYVKAKDRPLRTISLELGEKALGKHKIKGGRVARSTNLFP